MCRITSSEVSGPAGYPATYSFLGSQNESYLEFAALCADCVSEVKIQPVLASVGQPTDNAAFLQEIADLFCQVAALSARQD
jgi:hypothetical protein